jgi:hypothetical protein
MVDNFDALEILFLDIVRLLDLIIEQTAQEVSNA